MKRVLGFSFQSPLKLQEMLLTLNTGGPWIWCPREGSYHGDYLICNPDDNFPEKYSKIRIIENGGFVLDVLFVSESPQAEEEYQSLLGIVRETIFPLLQAQSVADTEYCD